MWWRYVIYVVVKNFKNISKTSKPSGGKSGEFFFFTYDNKYFIKTMKTEEVKSIKNRAQVLIMFISRTFLSTTVRILIL